MRPFQWQTSLIPVLPTALLESLEAPVPMLAGISYAQYEQCGEMLTEAEFEARIWVDCSTGKVTWPKSLHVEQFHFGGL